MEGQDAEVAAIFEQHSDNETASKATTGAV
jgi:hypothetical protein